MEETGKIAICKNEKIFSHEGSWTDRWIKICKENKISYEVFDPYQYDVIKNVKKYSILLWHIQNYVYCDILEANKLLNCIENKGILTFPNHNTRWHFDDKIAEMYLFQMLEAPIPKSWVFYVKEDCIEWLKKEANYPLVAKLRCGSGANNVKLLRTSQEAIKYANKMFGKGLNPAPSFMYKAYSKAQSSKNIKTILNRIKKIPQFLHTLSRAKKFPNEKGYCYFQEYIENEGYDLKIVVVGDKLSFIARNIRKGDWRASGGGDIHYNKSLVTKEIIDSAFMIADKGKFQCMGFDYIVSSNTKKCYIVEMCFGFDSEALYAAGGYYDRNGIWYEKPLDVPYELLLQQIKNSKKV